MMKGSVLEALEELRQAFPENVVAEEDGEGGAYVKISDVALAEIYVQPNTWVGFRIPFQYPQADVYPHFVRPDLARRDGRPLGEAMTSSQWRSDGAIQISRRSSRRDGALETALIKLDKVIEWLRRRP